MTTTPQQPHRFLANNRELLQIVASFCHAGELNRFAAVCRSFRVVAGRSHRQRVRNWSSSAAAATGRSVAAESRRVAAVAGDDGGGEGIAPLLYDYDEAPVCYTHAWWKWFDDDAFDNGGPDSDTLKTPCKLDLYGESPHHWECETTTQVVMVSIDEKKANQPQQKPALKLAYNEDEFYEYKKRKGERWYPIDSMVRLVQSQSFVLPDWSRQGLTQVRHASLADDKLLFILCRKSVEHGDRDEEEDGWTADDVADLEYNQDPRLRQTLYAVAYTNVRQENSSNNAQDSVVHHPFLVSRLTEALGPERCGVIRRSRCFVGNAVRSARDRIAVLTSIKDEDHDNDPRNTADDATVTVYRMIIGNTDDGHDNNNNKKRKKQIPGTGDYYDDAGTAHDVRLIREYSIPVDCAGEMSADYADIQLSLSPSGDVLSIRNKISNYENGGWTFYDLSKPMPLEASDGEDDSEQEQHPTNVFHIPVTSVAGPSNDAIQSISYTLDDELVVQWEDREQMERFLRLGNHPEMDDSLWEPQQQRRRGRHRSYQGQRRLKGNIRDLPIKKLPKVIARRIVFIAGRPRFP